MFNVAVTVVDGDALVWVCFLFVPVASVRDFKVALCGTIVHIILYVFICQWLRTSG